jgi:hypothetical protein
MAGLVPAIHADPLRRAFAFETDARPLIRPSFAVRRDVDARDERGHDGSEKMRLSPPRSGR